MKPAEGYSSQINMPNFLRPDQISFWLIILAIGIILWFRKLWVPLFKRTFRRFQNNISQEEKDETSGIEIMYRQELFQLTQANHLASDLFPLSEITIIPKIQVQTPDYDPENPISHLPLTNEIIPYLPELPSLAAFYNSPTIRVDEAIELGLNIGLIGRSGSGKTHTLNWLAVEISQRNPQLGSFSERLPIYLNVSNLDLKNYPSDKVRSLTQMWDDNQTILNIKELQGLFKKNLIARNVIFLIDGLDEVPNDQIEKYLKFIQDLRSEYPGNKFLVSLSPFDLSALEPLNLYPLSLAYWNVEDQVNFSVKWNTAWKKASKLHSAKDMDTPEFITRKLFLESGKGLSPFEMTLKLWGLYAGDIFGENLCNDFDSYIGRQTHKLKNAPLALEAIAAQIYQQQKPLINEKVFGGLNKSAIDEISQRAVRNLIPALINRGVLHKILNNQIGFVHSNIFAYFAAKNQNPSDVLKMLDQNFQWEPNHLIHQFSPKSNVDPEFIDQCFRSNKTITTRPGSLLASHWLKISPDDKKWLPRLLQLIAVEIQNTQLPYSLRIRILSQLAFSGINGIRHLFRKLIQSSESNNIILGLIGAGIVGDIKNIDQIAEHLFHENPLVNQAASLALSNFNTKESIEKLLEGFLHASDSAKIIVAETLALDDNTGHEILRDGAEIEDPAVRRASVFGLSRIRKEWSMELIEDLSQNDREWLVRIAAADALSLSSQEKWKYPTAIVNLKKTSWLVNFAAENGVGIGNEQSAWDLVETAVSKGNQQQKLAALNLFGKVPYKAFNLSIEIIRLLNENDLMINERAYNLLLSLQSLGISIKH